MAREPGVGRTSYTYSLYFTKTKFEFIDSEFEFMNTKFEIIDYKFKFIKTQITIGACKPFIGVISLVF